MSYSRFVLRNKLRAVGQVFFWLPRVVHGVMSLPPDQIVYASADGPTIQQLLDHVLAFLAGPGVIDRAWGALAIVARLVRLQAVDIYRRTAFEAPRESKGVGIRARNGRNAERTVPPGPELPDLRKHGSSVLRKPKEIRPRCEGRERTEAGGGDCRGQ